ncbi:MAG: hypothetical protein ACXWUG_06445 [Polyangiales bacterium]
MPSPYFPEFPAIPAEQRGESTMMPRYEDVAQDGRFMLTALPVAMGEAVWRGPLSRLTAQRALLQQGVIPILARIYVEGTDEHVPVTKPVDVSGAYALAHDGEGKVERILLNTWADIHGVRGRTHVPHGEGDGVRVKIGRIFAEHVFTRPWGAKEDRKVVRFDAEGVPPVPADRHAFRPLASSMELPAGATLLEEKPVLDDVRFKFGLSHTDSNQHVNSLVYLRLFEEALSRRAPKPVLVRWAEIAYRKPCFAGETVRVRLQYFEHGGEVGAVGAFVPADDPETDRPIAYVRMGAR